MRKIVLSIFAVLAVSFTAVAQNQRVTGTVRDANGVPIIGANVIVTNTQTGASTGADGSYSIQVPANGSLTFSYLSKTTQVVPVNRRTVIDVTLEDDAIDAGVVDIVAPGYGGYRGGSNVGAMTSVGGETLKAAPVANATDALQGKIAGLDIISTSGDPGVNGVSMYMRGISSINASTTPLYLVDGVPVSSYYFNLLNAADIEGISVLKDAASTAIYGARAANGVIFVTTKKGARNMDAKVQLTVQSGVSKRAGMNWEMMTARELYAWEEANDPSLLSNATYQKHKEVILSNNLGFDWDSYAFKPNVPTNDLNLNIVGGTEASRYLIGANYHYEDGTGPQSYMERYSFRVNYDTNLKSWLNVATNFSVSQMYSRINAYINSGDNDFIWNLNNPALWIFNMAPYYAPYALAQSQDDQSVYYWDKNKELLTFPFAYNMTNQILFSRDYQRDKRSHFNIDGSLVETIKPIKNLTIKFMQGINMLYFTTSSVTLPSYYVDLGSLGLDSNTGKPKTSSVTKSLQQLYTMISSNTADYSFTIDDDHNITFLVGQESTINSSSVFQARANGLTDDRLVELSSGVRADDQVGSSDTESVFNSYFGRVNYDYSGKYFADVTFRRDGSSRFGQNTRYGNFYSVGAMWNVKSEDFMANISQINDLRLRINYGETGNAGIGDYYFFQGMGKIGEYDYNIAWGLGSVGNSMLTWEKVGQFSVSLEGRAFNMVDFEVAFYDKITSDMLQNIPYSATTGYSGGWANVGSMRNRGFEFTAGVDILQIKDFMWNVNFNVAYNKNTILELYQGAKEIVLNSEAIMRVGHPYFEFVYAKRIGVDPADGKPIWQGKNGLTKVWTSDLAVTQEDTPVFPYWTGGFGTTFAWKGLSLQATFSFVGDKYITPAHFYYTMNSDASFAAGERNVDRRMQNMWREAGQVTNIPAYGTAYHSDSPMYDNAAFVRLKLLTLSYNFPKKWIQATKFIQGARIFFTGRNLLTFTGYDGYDPEGEYQQVGEYPNSRQYVGGIELTF